jgi:hypothetical protein
LRDRTLRAFIIQKIKASDLCFEAFVIVGGIMNKCRRCVWGDKISSNLIFCIFPGCIRKSKRVNKNDRPRKNI